MPCPPPLSLWRAPTPPALILFLQSPVESASRRRHLCPDHHHPSRSRQLDVLPFLPRLILNPLARSFSRLGLVRPAKFPLASTAETLLILPQVPARLATPPPSSGPRSPPSMPALTAFLKTAVSALLLLTSRALAAPLYTRALLAERTETTLAVLQVRTVARMRPFAQGRADTNTVRSPRRCPLLLAVRMHPRASRERVLRPGAGDVHP